MGLIVHFDYQTNLRCIMFEDYDPVDSLLTELKGNTNFLTKFLFPNIKFVFIVLSYMFMDCIELLCINKRMQFKINLHKNLLQNALTLR